jgi:hypothetical protein
MGIHADPIIAAITSRHVTSRYDSRVLHGEQAELDRGHGLARK